MKSIRFKKTISFIMLPVIIFSLSGCAAMPAKYQLEAMDKEAAKKAVAEAENNRSMWQAIGGAAGGLSFAESYRHNTGATNILIGSIGITMGMGIATALSSGTFEAIDVERDWFNYGLIFGSFAAVAVTAWQVSESISVKSNMALLSLFTIFMVIPFSLSGGGLGAMTGKTIKALEKK